MEPRGTSCEFLRLMVLLSSTTRVCQWGYPYFIRLHWFIIIISMPTPKCMTWIHYLQLPMPETSFSKHRPFRLCDVPIEYNQHNKTRTKLVYYTFALTCRPLSFRYEVWFNVFMFSTFEFVFIWCLNFVLEWSLTCELNLLGFLHRQ